MGLWDRGEPFGPHTALSRHRSAHGEGCPGAVTPSRLLTGSSFSFSRKLVFPSRRLPETARISWDRCFGVVDGLSIA